MSITFDLYNTSAEQPQMNQWDRDKSLPIAKPKEVQDRIMLLYPRISHWNKHEFNTDLEVFDYPVFYSALAADNCGADQEYLDITLMQHRDGTIHFISIRKGSPKLVRDLLEEFNLQYVFEGQSCRLVDPYQFRGNWQPL